jgi:hypothetical protein
MVFVASGAYICGIIFIGIASQLNFETRSGKLILAAKLIDVLIIHHVGTHKIDVIVTLRSDT